MVKILIVDDSGYTRGMIAAALRSSGYNEIFEASTGQEAIQKFEAEKPDLVLLDLVLMEMGGLEVLAEIRKRSKDAKVIILSAIGQDSYVSKANALNVTDYMTKPFSPKELLAKIKALFAD